QPRTAARGARVEAAVARDQHARLHLVALALEPLEEAAHAVPVAARRLVALDDERALGLVEVLPRGAGRNAEALAGAQQVALRGAHLGGLERRDRARRERE